MIDPMQDPLRPTSYLGDAGNEHPAEQVLRKLACWLGVGGYNAAAVDANVFHEKIVWGIQNLMQDKHAGLTQCGWADEFGNVFPVGAWQPQSKKYLWLDAHKKEWVPVYKASCEPQRPLFTMAEIAEAAARADVPRLDFQHMVIQLEAMKPKAPQVDVDAAALLRMANGVREWMGQGCVPGDMPKPQIAALAEVVRDLCKPHAP